MSDKAPLTAPTARQAARSIPVNLTAAQVDDLLTDKDLLYGIFRAVSRIQTIVTILLVLVLASAAVGALGVLAAVASSTSTN
jgi:hypothetical protein